MSTWGSPVRPHSSYSDAFVARLDASGTMVWNTFLGGSGSDSGNSIAMDGLGNAWVTGHSSSTWGNPMNAYSGSGYDVFVARLDGRFSSYLPIIRLNYPLSNQGIVIITK